MKRLALIVGLVSAAAGSAVGAEADLERLDAAQARWQAAAAGDYRYAYQRICDCYRDEPPETVVTVSDGRVTEARRRLPTGREIPTGGADLELYWTIEDLFAKLSGAYSSELAVRVEYDADYGYPLTLFIDNLPDVTGDETEIRLTRFEIR